MWKKIISFQEIKLHYWIMKVSCVIEIFKLSFSYSVFWVQYTQLCKTTWFY